MRVLFEFAGQPVHTADQDTEILRGKAGIFHDTGGGAFQQRVDHTDRILALHDHGIPYLATEFDPDRMLRAVADGYHVSFGDASNMKLIEAIGGNRARALVLGLPRYEVSRDVTPTINRRFPNLKRFVTVDSPDELDRYNALGIRTHLAGGEPHGIEMVIDMLAALGVPEDRVSAWLSHETERYAIGEAKPAETVDDLDPLESDIGKAA